MKRFGTEQLCNVTKHALCLRHIFFIHRFYNLNSTILLRSIVILFHILASLLVGPAQALSMCSGSHVTKHEMKSKCISFWVDIYRLELWARVLRLAFNAHSPCTYSKHLDTVPKTRKRQRINKRATWTLVVSFTLCNGIPLEENEWQPRMQVDLKFYHHAYSFYMKHRSWRGWYSYTEKIPRNTMLDDLSFSRP